MSTPSDLLGFVRKVTGREQNRVEEDLGEGYVRLHVSEAQRRQARHDIQRVEDLVLEILRNSRDAGASHILVATHRDLSGAREVVVADDGCGVPAPLHELIFEPRVTSKLNTMIVDDYGVHGRGMALYSIKQVAKEATLVYSRIGRGSIFRILVDTGRVPERRNQSTFPQMRTRDGKKRLVGPHNILRVVAELALKHSDVRFFIGTPVEVLATMRELAGHGLGDQSPWGNLRPLSDADELSYFAEELGLLVSASSARRVIEGEVRPLPAVFSAPTPTWSARRRPPRTNNLSARFSSADVAELSAGIGRMAAEIGARHGLEAAPPRVRREGNRISISIGLGERNDSEGQEEGW